MPPHLLCSHLPLQAPDAPLCPLHLPRSRQTCCLQLRKLLLQAERPLSRSVQLVRLVLHLQGACASATQPVASTWCFLGVK